MLTQLTEDVWVNIDRVTAVTIEKNMDVAGNVRRIHVFFDEAESSLSIVDDPKRIIEIINGIGRYRTAPRQTMEEVQAATDKTLEMLGFKSP